MEQLLKIEALKSLLITLALGLWLYWLWTRRNLYRFAMNFPGPFGLPLLGISYRVFHPKDILPLGFKLFEECKQDTFCTWAGVNPILVTSDPETAKNILSSPELLNKAHLIYDSIYDLLSGGLIASPVVEWQHNRKLINPSFNHKVLVSFFPIFHKAKKQVLTKFDAMVGTGENILLDLLRTISMGLSVETTMGKVMKEKDEVDEHIIKTFSFLLEALVMRVILTFLKLQGFFAFYKRYQKSKKDIYRFVDELIQSKLQRLRDEHEQNVVLPANDMKDDFELAELSIKKAHNIFIDQAIQIYQKDQFTWNDIIAESMSMVTASFDTTATGIFSTLLMLAMHPEVQEKLYEEILSVFPEKDFQMEYTDMHKLPYLDMVINETLRLMPSAPMVGRQVVKDTLLTKDILLPKDLTILISIFHLHRNANVWGPNAQKFNPDNFLPQNLAEKHSHAFIPFSKGARNCIGWRYALFFMKIMLAGCVRNFRYTTTFKFEDLEFVESTQLKYLIEPSIEIHSR